MCRQVSFDVLNSSHVTSILACHFILHSDPVYCMYLVQLTVFVNCLFLFLFNDYQL